MNNEQSAQHTEPAIIQSAFRFKNGTHFLVTTSLGIIRSFYCDENFKPTGKPYAECPLNWGDGGYGSATNYHLNVRSWHDRSDFVPDHSTNLRRPGHNWQAEASELKAQLQDMTLQREDIINSMQLEIDRLNKKIELLELTKLSDEELQNKSNEIRKRLGI